MRHEPVPGGGARTRAASRVWLAAIVAVAVAVRVGWVVLAARRPVMGDPVAYTYHGTQLARGQGYRSFVAAYTTRTPPEHSGGFPPTAFYPIGYPAALAIVFWLVFHTPLPDNLPRAVGFFQVGLGVGSVLIAAEVATTSVRPRRGLHGCAHGRVPQPRVLHGRSASGDAVQLPRPRRGPRDRLGAMARHQSPSNCWSSASCSGCRRSCGPSRCSCSPGWFSCGCSAARAGVGRWPGPRGPRSRSSWS